MVTSRRRSAVKRRDGAQRKERNMMCVIDMALCGRDINWGGRVVARDFYAMWRGEGNKQGIYTCT
jgi:hypothetical protein